MSKNDSCFVADVLFKVIEEASKKKEKYLGEDEFSDIMKEVEKEYKNEN